MKRIIRAVSALITLSFILPLFAVFPTAATNQSTSGDARYTQKIVSVVYDNSSSMWNEQMREPASKYALEMLMSLLDERDLMVITPMNDGTKTSNPQVTDMSLGIDVDLSAPDRNAEIDRVLSNARLNITNAGMTPAASVTIAIDELEERGLQNTANLWKSDEGKEYWLIILTDGGFNYVDTADAVASNIADFPTLHTVYVGFGKDAVNLQSASAQAILGGYQFTAYQPTEKELAADMQKIANQMSGRYALDPSTYTVSGKTLTVDLSGLEFSLSSLSLIAQDCGATAKSVTYNGTAVTVGKPCIYDPGSALGMEKGYSCEIDGDPYLMGGKLVVEFSAPVAKENLSIFAEPALRVSYYIEYKDGSDWKRVDRQYLNENFSENDEIRVGYEVREQVNGTLIDMAKIFGAVETKVKYAGEDKTMGTPFPLKVGSHELSISISVMDGAYTLRDSDTVTVEKNPSFYRVEYDADTEVEIGKTSATATYTVYVNDQPATPSVLNSYTWSLTATAPDGSAADVTASVGSDGKITATLNVKETAFGAYQLKFYVESEFRVSRSVTHEIKYYPTTATLAVKGTDHLSITQHSLKGNTQGVSFELTTNGQPFLFENGLTTYELSIGGVDVTQYAVVDGHVLTYVPEAEHLSAIIGTPGDKEIVLSLKCAAIDELNASVSARLTVIETLFVIETVPHGNKSIDRFRLSETDAVVYFRVLRDGKTIPLEELEAEMEKGNIRVKDQGTFSGFFWLPCGRETSLELLNGEAVIAVRIVKDWAEPFA